MDHKDHNQRKRYGNIEHSLPKGSVHNQQRDNEANAAQANQTLHRPMCHASIEFIDRYGGREHYAVDNGQDHADLSIRQAHIAQEWYGIRLSHAEGRPEQHLHHSVGRCYAFGILFHHYKPRKYSMASAAPSLDSDGQI